MPAIFKQERWNLEDLFISFESPGLKRAVKQIEREVGLFELYRQELSGSMAAEQFVEIVWAYEKLSRLLSRLTGFASLSFAADTQDQKAQAYLAQFRQLTSDAENETLFFKMWWKSLDEEAASRLMEAAGEFGYWLHTLRQEGPYTLTEAEERIINLKDVNGSQALVTLMSTITDRYSFKLEVDGKLMDLTREELRSYFHDRDPDRRQAAYIELFRVYEQDKNIIGQLYQYRVMDWYREKVDLRKYAAPISVRNLANDVADDVVDTLLAACRENAAIFQRYYQLKARWLGLDKLRRYDLLAPVLKADRTYSFQEAADLVLSSFGQFHPQLAVLAARVFHEGHIDSEARTGKRGGAFCSTITPNLTPWILQTFRGRPEDVSTMAHELGHAVHSMLASSHSALTQHASLPLAETASNFGEMIVLDRLLEEDPDPSLKIDLLFRTMDRSYSSIMRQAYFALFEQDAHKIIKEGATIDDVSGLFAKNLATQFGESVEISEEFKLEWLTIPHFFRYPFYVYAYAFGQLLVLSLYQQYRENREWFIPRYLEVLSAGGSAAPVEILDKAGVDIHSLDFWQGGFDVLASNLNQLEAMEPSTV